MSEDGTSGPSGGRSYGGLLANATFTSADGGGCPALEQRQRAKFRWHAVKRWREEGPARCGLLTDGLDAFDEEG